MIITDLKIKKFNDLDDYVMKFSEISIIKDKSKTNSIVKAIGIVLQNKIMYGDINKLDISNETEIDAVIKIRKDIYNIEVRVKKKGFIYNIKKNNEIVVDPSFFYNEIRQSQEEERFSYYNVNKDEIMFNRLGMYKDYAYYFKQDEFLEQTDGIGLTRSFSNCLRDYMREFKKEEMNPRPRMEIDINKQGFFVVKNNNGKEIKSNALKEEYRYVFDYLCFININEFWGKMEEIREMDHIKTPLIISDIDSLVYKWDMDFLIKKAIKLGRQIIVFTKNIEPTVFSMRDKNRTFQRVWWGCSNKTSGGYLWALLTKL